MIPLCWSSDGKILFVHQEQDGGGDIFLTRVSDGKILAMLPEDKNLLTGVSISSNGDRLIFGFGDSVCAWSFSRPLELL